MNFERGLDPKIAMGTGWRAILETMPECLFITENDLYQRWDHQYHNIETVKTVNIRKQRIQIYNAFVIIIVIDNKFRIMKNRFSHDQKIYQIEELPRIVINLKSEYDAWMGNEYNKTKRTFFKR